MVKKFAFLSFGVLCLAIAALIVSNLTTREAGAQAGGQIVGYSPLMSVEGVHIVMLSNGDVYRNQPQWDPTADTVTFTNTSPVFMGNFWGQGTVQTSPQTWGGVKGQYDGKK